MNIDTPVGILKSLVPLTWSKSIATGSKDHPQEAQGTPPFIQFMNSLRLSFLGTQVPFRLTLPSVRNR
jgi:hypothetical protein